MLIPAVGGGAIGAQLAEVVGVGAAGVSGTIEAAFQGVATPIQLVAGFIASNPVVSGIIGISVAILLLIAIIFASYKIYHYVQARKMHGAG